MLFPANEDEHVHVKRPNVSKRPARKTVVCWWTFKVDIYILAGLADSFRLAVGSGLNTEH